jgi:nucleoside-diphosphate-sugar epimerase
VSLNQGPGQSSPVGDALLAAVRNCAAFVYCAGTVRGRVPADFEAANVNGLRTALQALTQLETPPPPFLLISSLAASRPALSDYAHSKYLGERVLEEFPGVPWTIIRPPAVYGPGERELRVLFKLARRGLLLRLGPSDQKFSLLHVDDLAAAIGAWLDANQSCRQQIFEIDDGAVGGHDWPAVAKAAGGKHVITLPIPRLILDVAARSNWLLSGLLGYAPMLTAGKVRELAEANWLGDNTEFHAATGWQPAIDLERGLRALFRQSEA